MNNIYKIRILGSTEIDHQLDLSKYYSIALKRVGVKNVKKTLTNEDDKAVYTYSLENLDIATLISEGETIQGKAKSISKGLRGAVYYLGQEIGVEDSEEFYQKFGKQIIYNLHDIYKMLNK